MNYLIGDLQGCCNALERLLEKIAFSPSRDHLYVLGDLINRGPQSLQTLRRLLEFGSSATCVLGNHDLSLLAVAQGVRSSQKGDTLTEILEAPDRSALLHWLRYRPMAVFEQGWLMLHAGVAPQWDLAQTMRLAAEVEKLLQSDALVDFLPLMYGDQPRRWDDSLVGTERLRLIINLLTRSRLMAPDGTLDMAHKQSPQISPTGLLPWFEVPGRRTQDTPIAFGHWAALGLVNKPNILALDTGCVWGRQLTAARIDGTQREIIQVECN
jgi:bis(5'-nucleosyl)-tetraphosphatase (symmetrical)